MSISITESSTQFEPSSIHTFDDVNIDSLQKKIESKMRKITAANKEIAEIHRREKLDLKSHNITYNFLGIIPSFLSLLLKLRNFTSKHLPVIFFLMKFPMKLLGCSVDGHTKKPASAQELSFQAIVEKNHAKLAQYEQVYRKCMTEYLDALDKTAFGNDEDPKFFSCHILSTSLPIVLPVGYGKNPEFLERQARSQRVFERAMSCRQIKDLYIEAMLSPDVMTKKAGSWHLVFVSADEEGHSFGAYCEIRKRLICIDYAASEDEALSSFVFELLNAVNSERLLQIRSLAVKEQINRDEYAKRIEAIEHEGDLRHHAIMRAVIREKGWSESLDEFSDTPKDFEVFWAQNKNGPHAERYRQMYDSIQRSVKALKAKL